jgi:hypothetical protein
MIAIVNVSSWTVADNLSVLWKYGTANPDDLWYVMKMVENYWNNYWTLACWWLCWWAAQQILPNGNYYMLSMTSDWTKWKVFINWSLASQNSDQATRYLVSSWSTTELRIGSIVRGWVNFKWIIDDVKIFHRALSDSEIRQQAKSAWF